jgi:putative transposase
MVDHVLEGWQVGIGLACRAPPVERSTYHYCSRRTERAGLKQRIKEIAWEVGLQLRNKAPKRRAKAKLRSDRTTATARNEIWAMDFVREHGPRCGWCLQIEFGAAVEQKG